MLASVSALLRSPEGTELGRHRPASLPQSCRQRPAGSGRQRTFAQTEPIAAVARSGLPPLRHITALAVTVDHGALPLVVKDERAVRAFLDSRSVRGTP